MSIVSRRGGFSDRDQHATVTSAVKPDATLDRRFWVRATLTALEKSLHAVRSLVCHWIASRIDVGYGMPAAERDATIAELARLSTKMAV